MLPHDSSVKMAFLLGWGNQIFKDVDKEIMSVYIN